LNSCSNCLGKADIPEIGANLTWALSPTNTHMLYSSEGGHYDISDNQVNQYT